MKNFLEKLAHTIHQSVDAIGSIVSWFAFLLVLVICLDVFTRYFLGFSSSIAIELEWHIFSLLFLLTSAYALKHQRHVRVDIWYHKTTERNRQWVNVFGYVFALLPFALLIIWTSIPYVTSSFVMGESSPDPGGLPFRWIIKSAIPVGAGLIFLQGIAHLIDSILFLKSGKLTPDDH